MCLKDVVADERRLVKKTDLCYWTYTFMFLRHNREILEVQDDANEKFEWVEFNWKQYMK